MKQVVLFSRVSTQVQNIESQTEELQAEAQRLGYTQSQRILIEYKESAIQLSIDERKGIQELKNRIESNKDIDCVIIYEISRLSRQMTMLFELRDYLIEKQIQLVCLKPYMRLLEDGRMSQSASILFSLMSSLSESEMMIKKERLVRGRIFKREQGGYIGGRILLGYRIGADDKIEIDYDDAETVRKIFRWYAEGKSMIWIGRELMERGLVLNRWNNINSIIQSIGKIFRREEYTGKKCHTYNYPQIISKELFDQVQARLTKNKPKTITKKQYLGQGLIRIKENGLLMSPNERNYSLNKIGRKRYFSFNTKTIEEWLWDMCRERVESISPAKAQQAYLHDYKLLDNKIHTVKVQISELQQRIDKINERIISGRMNEIKGDTMIQQYEHEIQELTNQQNILTDKLLKLKPTELDLSNHKSIVMNEIDVIYASDKGYEGKARVKLLEVHFKDGTTQSFHYKSKSQLCWIEEVKED